MNKKVLIGVVVVMVAMFMFPPMKEGYGEYKDKDFVGWQFIAETVHNHSTDRWEKRKEIYFTLLVAQLGVTLASGLLLAYVFREKE